MNDSVDKQATHNRKGERERDKADRKKAVNEEVKSGCLGSFI